MEYLFLESSFSFTIISSVYLNKGSFIICIWHTIKKYSFQFSSSFFYIFLLSGILGEGKAKFSFGKPSDQSVILVKLPPVYSGFVLAEKLHVHFSQSNHGKDQLKLFLKSRSDSRIDKNTKEMETEDVLYGYLAGIDDLDKLDSVTKKMYEGQKDIFKSRMEIAARAASYEKAAD